MSHDRDNSAQRLRLRHIRALQQELGAFWNPQKTREFVFFVLATGLRKVPTSSSKKNTSSDLSLICDN
jgi:hypothetical protein